MNIKYYRLAKDEEPPEEFCAVRDVGGEPSEYVFYVPESEVAKLRELMYERAHVYAIQNMTEDELRITATNVMEDNAKLRELFSSYWKRTHSPVGPNVERDYLSEMRELGIEAD